MYRSMSLVSRRERALIHRMIGCQRSLKSRRRMRWHHNRYKASWVARRAVLNTPKGIARWLLRNRPGQYPCLAALIDRESGWRVNATNPSSGAYGLPQSLPGAKMASHGSDWQTNPKTQLRWMISYCDGRYGSPCAADSFQRANGWY